MSFLISAPYPAQRTTTLLPSPTWGDSKASAGTFVSMRAMDGTIYTYVKSRAGKKKLRWDFQLSRNKALELREFFKAYFGELVKITDHDGDYWIGYLINNPFEFTTEGRANGWPGGEQMNVTIDFEEK